MEEFVCLYLPTYVHCTQGNATGNARKGRRPINQLNGLLRLLSKRPPADCVFSGVSIRTDTERGRNEFAAFIQTVRRRKIRKMASDYYAPHYVVCIMVPGPAICKTSRRRLKKYLAVRLAADDFYPVQRSDSAAFIYTPVSSISFFLFFPIPRVGSDRLSGG